MNNHQHLFCAKNRNDTWNSFYNKVAKQNLQMNFTMSQFGNMLSYLKIKRIIADPSQPDANIGGFKGKSALIQHAIQCDPHAQWPA